MLGFAQRNTYAKAQPQRLGLTHVRGGHMLSLLDILEVETISDIDEALANVRDTLKLRLTPHQREFCEDYRDQLLDRRLQLCAASKSF